MQEITVTKIIIDNSWDKYYSVYMNNFFLSINWELFLSIWHFEISINNIT